MGETSKLRAFREREGWFEEYLVGDGIDIGCGDDPVTPTCRRWDMMDGDAQVMKGVPNESFDWVYSSHCLEHVYDPSAALARWWEILKPGGHLIILVPDEDLYEQGLWPPHFNTDHKTTWTIHKETGWSPVCRSLAQELGQLKGGQLRYLRVLDEGYQYDLQQKISASVVMPEELAKAIQDKGTLAWEDLQKYDPMRLLGFWPVDQSTNPIGACVTVEGVVRKCR